MVLKSLKRPAPWAAFELTFFKILALEFYRARQSESAALHARAAGKFYAEAARARAVSTGCGLPGFWVERDILGLRRCLFR